MNAEVQLMQNVLNAAVRVKPQRDGVMLVNGADLHPEPIQWLWNGWLARGKMHLIAGAPGQGKTTIALALAATVTTGGRWPDGSTCQPGNVLIWSGEDDPADTLLPRLLASGAKRSRVYFVSGTRIGGDEQAFDPARDMAALQREAERIGDIRLIIVDPIVSAVTGDSHKNTETRRALQPLVDLASSMNAALVGITHFSKGGQGGDPSQRVLGSVAFTAVARVVLVAAKVKGTDGEDRRIFARSKSNIGPDGGGYAYHVEQAEPLPGIHASFVTWGAPVDGSARELLTDPNENDAADVSAKDSAKEFLIEALGDSPIWSQQLKSEAKDAGISWRTVERAKADLRVRCSKGHDNRWYWSLPRDPIEPTPSTPPTPPAF